MCFQVCLTRLLVVKVLCLVVERLGIERPPVVQPRPGVDAEESLLGLDQAVLGGQVQLVAATVQGAGSCG